ncbi:hypothetical protein [Parasphaerochaeta coccoides]|uniref:TP-1001-like C-terminal domain-containing protein n=1 Tax=Parasphaerochaeta coccoides (strain ATCC BAA-1237 / DSM 17374 / SPN1) TaxID=760011 RepID=F4GK78_PARC1|nr:hypothetical protein [Parasphaerochaeta coccoides]AEC02274.1 hypothetical protein Spico_1053 [Parasphaerochaeta coccoides DSM 17374]
MELMHMKSLKKGIRITAIPLFYLRCTLFLIILFLATACGEELLPLDLLERTDCSPPALVSIRATGNKSIRLCFSEKVEAASARVSVEGETAGSVTQEDDFSLVAHTSVPLIPGKQAWVSFVVEDISGNALWARVPIWGFNAHAAHLLITEFTTKGTEKQPDRVELVVLKSGDLAGITLSSGLAGRWTDRCVLPPGNVDEGTFIVVFFQDGNAEDIPKNTLICRSQELLGLPGSNGILVLTDSPSSDATIIDCVLYASHTKTAHGFGTEEVWEQANLAIDRNAWKPVIPNTQEVDSSWAVDSAATTSTRSLCRRDTYKDTDTKNDWYVCATKKASFGSYNSREEWEGNQER